MRIFRTALLLFLLTFGVFAQNQVENPDPLRFEKEISYFKNYDARNSFPQKAVLFVGSSSIRLWKTHLAFPAFPVINRGVGGSHISDVLFFYDSIVKKYRPALIVFYAGDNDIAAGKSVDKVFNDFKTFFNRVKKDMPRTKVIYLPIKPSILRWKFWDEMKKVNEKVLELSRREKNLFYADLASVLLKNGEPDPELYIKDGLHLNENGYEKWNNVLRPILQKLYSKITRRFPSR